MVFFSISIHECSSTNSAVAPSAYPMMGTPMSNASAVPIPKLSLVRLMIPFALRTIFCVSSGDSRPRKMVVSQAMDFK